MLAAIVEHRVGAAYQPLVALSDRILRAQGAAALRESALRAAHWRGRTMPFPGLARP